MARRRPASDVELALSSGERVPVQANTRIPKKRLTGNKVVIELGGGKKAIVAFDEASGQVVKLEGEKRSTVNHRDTLGPVTVHVNGPNLGLRFFMDAPDSVYLEQMTTEEKLRIGGVNSKAQLFWARRTVPQRIVILLGAAGLAALGLSQLACVDAETAPTQQESGMQVDD